MSKEVRETNSYADMGKVKGKKGRRVVKTKIDLEKLFNPDKMNENLKRNKEG